MRLGEWTTAWLTIVNKTRFDAEDLYEMLIIKVFNDWAKGLLPYKSAAECLEIADDFVQRYYEVKKC